MKKVINRTSYAIECEDCGKFIEPGNPYFVTIRQDYFCPKCAPKHGFVDIDDIEEEDASETVIVELTKNQIKDLCAFIEWNYRDAVRNCPAIGDIKSASSIGNDLIKFKSHLNT